MTDKAWIPQLWRIGVVIHNAKGLVVPLHLLIQQAGGVVDFDGDGEGNLVELVAEPVA